MSGYHSRHGTAPITPPPTKKRKRSTSRLNPKIADVAVQGTFKAVKQKLVKGKSMHTGSKKEIKVSKQFRENVKEVLKDKSYYGRLMATYAGSIYANIPPNKASYFPITTWFGDGYREWYWTPSELMSVANSCFLNDATFPRAIVQVIPPTAPPSKKTVTGTTSFTVVNSYMNIKLKNNTSNTFQIDFYTVQPKIQGQSTSTTYDIQGNGVNSVSAVPGLIASWLNAVGEQKESGLLNPEYSPDDWSNSPFEITGVSRQHDHELTRIIIGPGQTENIVIQGPKNLEFSYDKCWKNTQFCDVMKYSKQIVTRVQLENLTDGIDNTKHGIPGYTISNGGATPVDPVLEMIKETRYHITMPDQTLGWLYTSNPDGYAVAAARRSRVLRKYQFFSGGMSSTGLTTLPEQPFLDKVQT